MPVNNDSASETSRTRRSIEKSSAIGSAPGGGGAAWNDWIITHATPSPMAPPMSDNSRLSVSSCRTMRVRLAPTASRTASSRCLAAALASSRLAIFAQAISNTAAATPPSSSATACICRR
jgi:hypothetical protein